MDTATMKQRLTYVVKKPESFSPDLIEVKNDGPKDTFALKGVQAAKEHRITLGLDELPSEVGPIHHIRGDLADHSSSVLRFENGMSFTSAGLHQQPTLLHHHSHHVCRQAYMSCSHLSNPPPRTRYADNCMLS
jgi:nucleoside diphosphate kinase